MKTETIDDGGPISERTVRDWFAGQALAGQLASMSSPKAIEAMSSFGDRAFEWAAKSAYNFADAMILARKGAKP